MSLKPLNSVGGFSVGNGTITTVIYPNTDVTTANLVVTNYANLGDIANVYIGGGTNGAILSTDGTGVLSWSSSPGVTEIQNGNSNVSIPTTSGNIYINANAGTDYQWNFDTTGNLNIPQGGYVASGNAALELSDTSSVWLTPNVNADLTGLYMVDNGSAQLYAYSNVSIYSNEVGPQYEWNFDNTGNLVLPNNSVGYATITAQAANNISIQTGGATYSQVILNDGGDVIIYGNAQTAEYVFGANGTFSVGSGTTIDFNTNGANVQLGSNANVHIYGGTTGQVLQTDGNGNLNWYSVSATGIQNGNSNVTITDPNGNIYINANAGVDQQWNFGTDGVLTTPGNINLSGSSIVDNLGSGIQLYSNNYAQLNYNNSSYVYVESDGVWLDTNSGSLNLDNNGNVIITGNLEVQGNIANVNNISVTNSLAAGSANITNDLVVQGNIANANNISATNNILAGSANITNDLVVQGNIANANNISVTNNITAGSANVTNDLDVGGNIVTGTGSGGNISGVDYLFADYANITYDVNAGNTVTANYFYANTDANIAGNLTVQSNANIVGNLTAGNIIGIFANGTSNVAIPVVNGNINLSVGGNANVLTVVATGANVIGTFYANGNITTTSTFVGNTITSTGTYLTIASDQDANGTYNINLVPGGAGNVDVHSTNITSLADPVNPQDAATKQYVDNISQGLYVHPAANLLTSSNLNATYNNGGTSLTVTDIIGNSVVQFSAAHGLTIGNSISFTNSFNGINGDPDVYYVASVPAPNQITLKDEYFGPSPVETLIAGSGLTQPALGSPGIGATLTNAGTNAALVVDSVTTTVGLRVLVTGQTTQAYNGIYDVTTVGDVSTPWVMTRSTDGDQYIPQSSNGLCGGSYFFVTEGAVYGGSSWIVTTAGEIDIGVSNVAFVQFSQGGAYTGANGISVIGTQITANVDNVTTAIISGNITVAANAQLVTPNIGDATGTSLNLTGNLLAGNVNSNAATITDTLTVNTYANVGNLITVGYGNIGTDLIVGGNANITGNVQIGTGSGGNITGVNYISANYANIANDVTANGNVTALSGNIAADAFYGNSITINNGGNANITGNLTTNYIFANYDANISGNANVTLAINGNTANFSGNVFVGNSSSNVNITTDGNVTATGTVNAYDANVGNSITLGNTAVYWATVTTSTIAANQTVAQIPIANITGVEFFIKGVDQNGVANKYSAATVMAVTDGTNADFVIYGTTFIGATTGGLVVNIVGSNIALQVSPASTNSTVWTTQFRTI